MYFGVKIAHVVSASILFGTGIGTAFFMLQSYRSGSLDALAVTTKNVVLADWLFTTPAVVVQFFTGLWLTANLGIPYGSLWFVAVVGLFIFVGACWIPVVVIQIRMRMAIEAGAGIERLAPLMRIWVLLGIPAFACVLLLYVLMATKFGANVILLP